MHRVGLADGWLPDTFRATMVLVSVLAALIASTPRAHASCGSSTCFLVTWTEEGGNIAGTLRADLSFRYIDQDRLLARGHRTGEVLVPNIDFETGEIERDHHREISTRTSMVQLDLAYGATARLTLVGVAPLLIDKLHEHDDDVGDKDEHFTSGDGTRGFGDVQLGARYAIVVGPKNLLLGGLMVKAPTGAYKLRDGEGAINEPTIQPGTGSFDYVGSVYYSHHPFPSAFEWFASGSYRLNGENSLDYRIGDETVLNLGMQHGGSGKMSWSVQVNARHASRDQFLGHRVPSTGSDYVNFTPGVRYATSSTGSLYSYLQIPVHQRVNESQLVPRWGLVLGVSKLF